MSVTLKPIGDCCEPCESPLVVNTPGPAGAAGADGADGTDGENAFTETTANFTQPAVGANVTVSVASSEWMVVGQEIFIEAGGYYLVVSKPTSASATVTNRGYDANAAPTVIIASGSNVSPAGEKGETGAAGSSATVPLTTKGDILSHDGAATGRLGVGTNGQVLSSDSAQTLGVDWVTVQPNTATDNGIARYDGTTGKPVPLQDSKVVITDDGAVQASGSGGNARGTRAVDLQTVRADAAQVASATESVVAGGDSNKATGVESVVSGGLLNVASGLQSAVSGGDSNVASGDQSSISGGQGNQATGLISGTSGGRLLEANGDYSFCGGGSNNEASGDYSAVVGGNSAHAQLFGQIAHSSGAFDAFSLAQASELVWRNSTTNATPTELFLNGSTERATINDNYSWVFRLTIIGRSDLGAVAAWSVTGAISVIGAIPSLVSAVTVTLLAADATAIADGWGITGAISVTADTLNDALKIEVTGAAGKNIRWVAHARLVEVYWPD